MPLLHLVGVGPGDPELLTLKALNVLRRADVVCAPVARPGEPSQALSIIGDYLDSSRQQVLQLHFPMIADGQLLEQAWSEAAAKIAGHISENRETAFITLGDPLFYATTIHLMGIMSRDYPSVTISIVPGVTSMCAAAAEASFPIAEGAERLAVLPATSGLDRIREALDSFDTVVIMKVKPLHRELMELLRPRECSLILAEKVGMPGGSISTDFGTIAAKSPDYLSILIVRTRCSC